MTDKHLEGTPEPTEASVVQEEEAKVEGSTEAQTSLEAAAAEAKASAAQMLAEAEGKPEAEDEPKEPEAEDKAEDEPKEPEAEEPEAEDKAEEPEAEDKPEEPKAEEPKAEDKAEEPEAEDKVEEPEAEDKAEEPEAEDKPDEPKAEDKPEEPKADEALEAVAAEAKAATEAAAEDAAKVAAEAAAEAKASVEAPKPEEKKPEAEKAAEPKPEEKKPEAPKATPPPPPKPKPKPKAKKAEPPPGPPLVVGPSPHVVMEGWTTQRMMRDVLIALSPAILWAIVVYRHHALFQILVTVAAALGTEWLFCKMRGQKAQLWDLSAVVTGVILALTLPWQAPFYIGVIAAFMAIGLGKAAFGGLGFNIFNPAMVGRAFVMLSFAKEMGAGGYVNKAAGVDIMTQATPLTVVKEMAKAVMNGDTSAIQAAFEQATSFTSLFWGYSNGSIGETSVLAILLGGLWLCYRRSASWEIPTGVIGATLVLGGLAYWAGFTPLNPLDQVFGGALLFGAFFIATDPVSSPLSLKGKLAFGAGVGAFIVLIRVFSGYPEGVMFAVLLMNAMVPLINRWSVPTPLGGPVPVRK